jgi:hypothetical protein
MNWVWPSSPAQAPRIGPGDTSPRCKKLGLEFIGAAAIKGECRQRPQSRRIAIDGVEIRLEPPNRDDHWGRYTIGLLDPGEGRAILLNQASPSVQARGIDHPTGELFETLVENTWP